MWKSSSPIFYFCFRASLAKGKKKSEMCGIDKLTHNFGSSYGGG